MDENDTILVRSSSDVVTRGAGSPRELQVKVLAENVNFFLGQIERMLENVPEEIGQTKFRLTEFTVSAEINAKGAFILLGTGAEVSGNSGLTFKFERVKSSKGV
jgi:hypothetical protein